MASRTPRLRRSDAQREDARRWAVRLEGLLGRAHEGLASRTLLMERAEADRDRALQRLSSCSAEVGAYRGQRDEAVAALSALLVAVEDLTPADVVHHQDVAVGLGLPTLIARDLVERYRRPAAIIEAP